MNQPTTASPKRQFFLFLITGGIAALINIGSRIGFSQVLRFELAVLAAYAIGMVTAYALARRYVFIQTQQSVKRSFAAFALINLAAVLQTWLVSIERTSTFFTWHSHCFLGLRYSVLGKASQR